MSFCPIGPGSRSPPSWRDTPTLRPSARPPPEGSYRRRPSRRPPSRSASDEVLEAGGAHGRLVGAAAVGLALYILDLAGQLEDGIVKGSSVLYFVAMGIAMATGLWVWAWRPPPHIGPLIFWWPALSLAADLVVPYPTSRLVTTAGLALYHLV